MRALQAANEQKTHSGRDEYGENGSVNREPVKYAIHKKRQKRSGQTPHILRLEIGPICWQPLSWNGDELYIGIEKFSIPLIFPATLLRNSEEKPKLWKSWTRRPSRSTQLQKPSQAGVRPNPSQRRRAIPASTGSSST